MNVSKDFCTTINDKNGIENPPDGSGNKFPPQDNLFVNYTSLFIGNYTRINSISDDPQTYITDQLEGCFEGGNDPAEGTYHYYRVLLAR